MSRCSQCKRKVPDHLLAPSIGTGGNVMDCCPVCALEIRNAELGLPDGTMFHGEIAASMYDEALEHYRKTKQSIIFRIINDALEDDIVLEDYTLPDIRIRARKELAKRGWKETDCRSEQIKK